MVRGETRPLPVAVAEVVPGKVDAKLNASIHNRFDVEVIDSRTGQVRQRAQAENIILDQLWANLSWYFEYIQYGTGTGVPAATDKTLFAYLGSKQGIDKIESLVSAGTWSCRKKIQLDETMEVGKTLTEVGIARSNVLVTHAMLVDMNGNQISIKKTDTDIINIYATVFVHISTSGYGDNSVLFALNNPNLPTLIQHILGYNGPYISLNYAFGANINWGARLSSSIYVNSTSTSKSYTLTHKAPRSSVTDANIAGGSNAIVWENFAAFLVGGSWYPGTQITGEAIGTGDGVKTDFKTKFGLATRATVFVNGIPKTSGISVSSAPYYRDNLADYFTNVDENNIPYIRYTLGSGNRIYKGTPPIYFYNPYYEWGIDSFRYSNSTSLKLYLSDDFVNWVTTSENIPVQYRKYRYFKLEYVGNYDNDIPPINFHSNEIQENNIHFTTPPPVGAIITADYFTKTIAKDENHVFDFSLTIQLGEYTPTV